MLNTEELKSDDQKSPLIESTSSESKQDPNHIVISPKFPPTVDMIELISKKSPDGRIPARAPNAFIIYRKVYVETARENGYYLPMTIVSSMASQSWESADETVKAEYRRIAKEALRVRNEMYPKSGRRKRKDRWNIVSFDPPTPPLNKNEKKRKNRNLKNSTKNIKGIKDNKHMESKDTSPVILDTISNNINSIPNVSFDMYSNTTFTNNPFLYEMYLADTDFNSNNPFNYQSPNFTSIDTPTTSNAFVPSTSCQSISFRQFDLDSELNTVFTQEPTFLNVNDQNLQILSNEDNEISSFAINHISANTSSFTQSNYDMLQPLQFHNFNMNESNFTSNDIYNSCYDDDIMSYPHA
ncbi:40430_t:CDS:1 [Gigaspora margarita]|uniref:40430_t:CDS:1 n=1 Tax=Gigaspora margarita TaxID=4874 RepID=A0ABN7VL88_GIGMA|nr:40430_t:CDS:1 [Gigaspora margarita]